MTGRATASAGTAYQQPAGSRRDTIRAGLLDTLSIVIGFRVGWWYSTTTTTSHPAAATYLSAADRPIIPEERARLDVVLISSSNERKCSQPTSENGNPRRTREGGILASFARPVVFYGCFYSALRTRLARLWSGSRCRSNLRYINSCCRPSSPFFAATASAGMV